MSVQHLLSVHLIPTSYIGTDLHFVKSTKEILYIYIHTLKSNTSVTRKIFHVLS